MANDLDAVCEQIRKSNPGIMSLIAADTQGKMLAHSYGQEYKQTYLKSATAEREKAGMYAVLLLGIEENFDEVFGKTEAIVKLHKDASLIVLLSPSKTKVFSIVTKNDVSLRKLLPKIEPFLKDL